LGSAPFLNLSIFSLMAKVMIIAPKIP